MATRCLFLLACFIVWYLIIQASNAEDIPIFGPLVPKESRRILVATESGVITAVDVFDGLKEAYHLQFFTLEPSSLFLPVLLHTDMVFYVQTGRGTVSWAREDSKDGTINLDVERGDIYRLEEGSIFYIRSHPDPAREKLRIHAIFNNFNFEDPQETSVGAYSNVSDLIRGFDDRVLQMGFKVSEEVVKAIKWAIKPPPIVHFAPNKTEKLNWTEVFESLMGGRNPISLINDKKKKKTKTKNKTFNVFKETPDVENCNGWSIAVTNRDLGTLKPSNIGVFMVNLTKGSMMGPHWNLKATEIATVIEGQGMVQIVCASNRSGSPPTGLKCQNMRFKVREGDLFIVPRFHPMAQMSFNNQSLVFMGFSTSVKNNHPQYLAGKWSVLRTIDRDILSVSLGASNATIEKMLASQNEGVMLECTSCAEEAEKTMEKETERRQEEEARKREEEEARRRREEEEEARKREEEEARRRREEEEARREEEEEEARKREEEKEAKRREEEEARKREEEEARKREEEEAKKKEREEEEAKRREEEEAKKREREEEEEEARKREEEEETRREEEAAKREEEARKREEEEEARRREDEKETRREEEAAKREEEARKREEEEARRREDEKETRREEEAAKREEEGREREEEEEGRESEEEIRRQEQEEIKRQEEEAKEREEGGGDRKREEAEEGDTGNQATPGGWRVMWRKIKMA